MIHNITVLIQIIILIEPKSQVMSIEQKIASRIEQYMPDGQLRKQVRIQILKQLTKTNKQILQQKTNEIRDLYTNKLKQQAQGIKENISSNLVVLNKQFAELQGQINQIKKRKLTDKEKLQIVEDTVEEIVSDEQMLEQIKIKLYPKVEEAVFADLESKLQNQLQQYQSQHQSNYDSSRVEWQRQRYEYWRAQSQRDIEVLAEQHKELECKKTLIMQSLTSKKAQRDCLVRQQNNLFELNNEIAYIKNQIKLLS